MRQNVRFFSKTAHPAYTDGRKNTGILIERIPRIEEMDQALKPFGWGAVPIDGLIPGVAFFDFQARGLLPIATDIRTLEHISYTPAPDIIHEAAGHAPILADPEYAEYVKTFGKIGAKALATKEEHEVFAATRHLSIVMENPNSTREMMEEAQKNLEQKLAQVQEVSEAAAIGRLYWWTVEYGLIGDLDNPKIYGAGLLSSIGESQHCLSEEVKKLPFDLETCIQTDYDVTRPQPQLFVCQSFQELSDAVIRFSERMAYRVGGTESLEKAVRSGSTATAVYDSGLEVSGTFEKLWYDQDGEAIYLKTTGPTALSYKGQQIDGHGTSTHRDGFGAPIGPVEGLDRCEVGKRVALTYTNGIRVNGIVRNKWVRDGKLLLLQLQSCSVTLGDTVLFHPDWGVYDLVIGEKIVSVFAEAADPEKFYEEEEQREDREEIRVEWSKLDHLYQQIREVREGKQSNTLLPYIIEELEEFPDDWLSRVELLEILEKDRLEARVSLSLKLRIQLQEIVSRNPELSSLVENGLRCFQQS